MRWARAFSPLLVKQRGRLHRAGNICSTGKQIMRSGLGGSFFCGKLLGPADGSRRLPTPITPRPTRTTWTRCSRCWWRPAVNFVMGVPGADDRHGWAIRARPSTMRSRCANLLGPPPPRRSSRHGSGRQGFDGRARPRASGLNCRKQFSGAAAWGKETRNGKNMPLARDRAFPSPRNPGLPGFRINMRKSGEPDLRVGRGRGGGR